MKNMKKRKKEKKNIFSVFLQAKTYLNMFYMLLLFPLGIITFVVLITLLAVSLGLISAPFLAPFGDINLGPGVTITSLPIKLLVSLVIMIIGVFILTGSLYIFNGLSWIVKKVLSVL